MAGAHEQGRLVPAVNCCGLLASVSTVFAVTMHGLELQSELSN